MTICLACVYIPPKKSYTEQPLTTLAILCHIGTHTVLSQKTSCGYLRANLPSGVEALSTLLPAAIFKVKAYRLRKGSIFNLSSYLSSLFRDFCFNPASGYSAMCLEIDLQMCTNLSCKPNTVFFLKAPVLFHF